MASEAGTRNQVSLSSKSALRFGAGKDGIAESPVWRVSEKLWYSKGRDRAPEEVKGA